MPCCCAPCVGLEQLGNSVLVVEHDEATIQSADLIVDLGPGAGVRGGNVVSIGTPDEIRNNPDSPTGAYLRSEKKRIGPKRDLTKPRWLTIRGAKANNLKNVDVKIAARHVDLRHRYFRVWKKHFG